MLGRIEAYIPGFGPVLIIESGFSDHMFEVEFEGQIPKCFEKTELIFLNSL